MSYKRLLVSSLSLLVHFNASAALTAGDIVVIGYHGDSPDDFSWVPLVDLNAGEVIYFTDAGLSASAGRYQSSGSASEFLLRYTVPGGGLGAGQVQTLADTNSVPTNYAQFTNTNFGARDVSMSGINLNQGAGDSVTVFQTTTPTSSTMFDVGITAIFALDTHDTPFTFDTNGASTTTDIPSGLVDGMTAVSASGDNTRYVGTTTGTREELLAAITNDSNWVGQNDTPVGANWSSNGVLNFTVTSVPEPSSALLLGSSLILLSFRSRR